VPEKVRENGDDENQMMDKLFAWVEVIGTEFHLILFCVDGEAMKKMRLLVETAEVIRDFIEDGTHNLRFIYTNLNKMDQSAIDELPKLHEKMIKKLNKACGSGAFNEQAIYYNQLQKSTIKPVFELLGPDFAKVEYNPESRAMKIQKNLAMKEGLISHSLTIKGINTREDALKHAKKEIDGIKKNFVSE